MTTLKPANGVFIKEGTKRKRSTRPPPAGKGKKRVENVVETESSDEKSLEPSPLKMRRRMTAEMV